MVGSSSKIRDIDSLAAQVSVPAIHIIKQNAPSRSHFGGSPRLPEDTPWPKKNGRRLGFVGRLSLKEIHTAHPVPWLPKDGALLFFYDLEEQPWGFDPKDRDGFAVLHVPDIAEPFSRDNRATDDIPLMCSHQNICFKRIDILPSELGSNIEALKITDKEQELLLDRIEGRYGEKPKHQVAGVPYVVQNEMELKCQLVSNGVYCGDPSGYKGPRAESLKAGAANWRLLLQVDTDDDLGVMWGDMGIIYFWVEEQKAKTGDFSNVWTILQCF